jgi:hypothetical protein
MLREERRIDIGAECDRPAIGWISPKSIRNKVVLPAPLGPTSATLRPRSSTKLTSLSTTSPS